MKFFPTEALTHAPISAVLDLVKENDLHPDQVTKIQIRSLARAADILSDPSKYDPHTKETADHSLPYVIAAALVDRQVTPAQFEMAKIMDPTIRAQLKKVEVVADPEIEKVFPALQRVIVNITTTDGRSFHQATRLSEGRSAQSAQATARSRRSLPRSPTACCQKASPDQAERRDLEAGEAAFSDEADGADEGRRREKERRCRGALPSQRERQAKPR